MKSTLWRLPYGIILSSHGGSTLYMWSCDHQAATSGSCGIWDSTSGFHLWIFCCRLFVGGCIKANTFCHLLQVPMFPPKKVWPKKGIPHHWSNSGSTISTYGVVSCPAFFLCEACTLALQFWKLHQFHIRNMYQLGWNVGIEGPNLNFE